MKPESRIRRMHLNNEHDGTRGASARRFTIERRRQRRVKYEQAPGAAAASGA